MSTSPEELIELVERHRDRIDLAEVGHGTTDAWIAKAEERLGIRLPESYKWFLKTFGGGEIDGEEIYSIYEMKFEDAAGGDIVYIHLKNQEQGFHGPDKLVVCDNNGEELFYFATFQMDRQGEYPIYRIDRIESTEEFYADSFLSFLKKRIEFLCQ